MNFSEYQADAGRTAFYPHRGANIVYPALGLAGEAGEVANKVKKVQRDHKGVLNEEMRAAIADELGDVLWYVAACCGEIGFSMNHVANMNLQKLEKRAEADKLTGSGDKR